jgi:PAS domain S-box-containing protein
LSNLHLNGPQQQALANAVDRDLQSLNQSFIEVVSYLQSASRNVSVRIDPAFQLRWSSMAIQSQTLASDASQLSNSLDNQAHQVNETNIYLIVSLVATFGALLSTIYLMVFRRTLKSVAELQKGINTIGSGKLDYVIEIKRKDEISELSDSFNQMSTNLKTVTSSKIDLEQEINQRKKTEEALRESEQRWSTTLSSIGDAVIATDMTGKISFMNGVAEVLTGWTLIEASQKPIREIFNIVNEQTRLEVENPINKVLREGMVVGLANHTVIIRKDGTEIPIDDSGAPIKDKEGKPIGVVLVFRDITARKQSEEKLEEYRNNLEKLVEERTKQLKDSERLAAIGATAGMVGHDIRNPLQAITGDLYLAKTELTSIPDSGEKKNALESLEEIEKNIDYINKIVADLQDYARPLNPRAQETNIRSLFNEILPKNGIPKNIKLTVDVDDKAEKVMADPDYLKRIVANLTLNAVQAMPDGGKLTIRAYSDKQTNDVLITVKDTGVGIPEDIKPKLFTPMMTTKSKGQGFGLAVVKRMTEGLGGTVTFESQEGKGTTFIVRLPPSKS